MSRLLHSTLMHALVPARLRLMRQLRRREGWDQAQIRDYQNAKLRELITHCWQYVPYYRSKWSGSIASPTDVQHVEDLERLPVLSKDELRENLPALTTTAPFVKSSPARSGGSTGSPTLFRMTRYDEEMAWAQMYTAWRWAGYRVGDPFQCVGGESIGVGVSDNRTRKDWIMNRWTTSGSNLTLERAKVLAASPHFHKIRFLYGYPSAIRELCDLLKTIGDRPRALKGVVCTAEIMRRDVRDEISRALGGLPVHDQYGLNDGGLFAAEGPEMDGLHVFFPRGILEVVDDANRQITEVGRSGRVIATCLTNLATPFVRYETGDDAHWYNSNPASSGVRWPRIGPVDGRTGDVIYLPSDRRIAMPGLTLVMRWIDGLKQYQFIQTSSNSVTVRLDRGSKFKLTEPEVLDYLRTKISGEIDWRIEWGLPELTKNQKVLIIRNDWLRAQGRDRPTASTG